MVSRRVRSVGRREGGPRTIPANTPRNHTPSPLSRAWQTHQPESAPSRAAVTLSVSERAASIRPARFASVPARAAAVNRDPVRQSRSSAPSDISGFR
jgi:hypothetical protein